MPRAWERRDRSGERAQASAGGRWLRDSAGLAARGASAQLIYILGTAFVVVLYGPEDLGSAAALTSLVGALSVVAALRYDVAIPLVSDEELKSTLALCGVLVLLTSIVVGGGLALAAPSLVDAAGLSPRLLPLRFALVPALFAAGLTTMLAQLATRARAYRRLGRTRVLQAVSNVGAQAAFGLVDLGAAGLAAASMVANGVATASLAPVARGVGLRRVERHSILAVAVQYRALPTWGLYTAVCQGALTAGLPVAVASLYGVRMAGLTVLAQRVVGLPLRIAGEATSRTFLGDAAALARRDPEALSVRLLETLRILALLAVPLAVLLALVAPGVAELLGDRWDDAGLLMPVLAPLVVAQFVAVPLNQALTVIQRFPVQAALATLRLLLTLGPLVVAEALGATAREALFAYAVGGAIAYLVGIVTILRLVRRWCERPPGRALVSPTWQRSTARDPSVT